MIRAAVFASLAAAALAAPAAAEEVREKSLNDPASHKHRTYSMVRLEADAGTTTDGEGIGSWEGDAWIGGDKNKLWFKTEGDVEDGETEEAELQALWSRNVATFWDLQAGVRHDFEPDPTTYLALGVQGLAPYQFETDAAAFLSEDGDVGVRFKQSFDVLLTQRLVLEPEVEVNAFAQDVPEKEVGAGFSDVEAKLKLRYEITRKFAPYVEAAYERRLGETASIARASGSDVDTTSIRIGVRSWF
ncbi:copper resistance protein B [Caulobacter sp. 17J80-11]|uniref:copper resistance protein B n=1 Tax=Caulobacter sp. 17J80-11 TaxID=2763502 RepID=UPI001653A181|nr:copper resistance protein B [Caulobacter sp. 17J80-11]MBC6981911.1 copper resistance protein B [Caulobacter sp. 17J80-11]